MMGVPKFGGERVAISAARTARDAVLVAAGKLGGGFPGPIVGHRTFDREDAAVVVGDDQEERLGRVGVIGDVIIMEIREDLMVEPLSMLASPVPFCTAPASTQRVRSAGVDAAGHAADALNFRHAQVEAATAATERSSGQVPRCRRRACSWSSPP